MDSIKCYLVTTLVLRGQNQTSKKVTVRNTETEKIADNSTPNTVWIKRCAIPIDIMVRTDNANVIGM